jgi:hypothetical protein
MVPLATAGWMVPLATAFFTATLALLGNIFVSVLGRHRERRSIAAALAGEIGAYIRHINPSTTVESYRKVAAFDHAMRRRRLNSMPQRLPDNHPVFDKVADKIGLLPVAEAEDVSSLYNVITGMRLMIAGLSSEEIANADDEVQIAYLNSIAETIKRNHQPALDLIERLKGIANQSLCPAATLLWSRCRTIVQAIRR